MWSVGTVRVILEGKGIRSLPKAEREFIKSFPTVYQSNLRRAVLKRLRGFHDLRKLAQRFHVSLSDLKAFERLLFVEPTLELLEVRRSAFLFALSVPEIRPVEAYDKVIYRLLRAAIRRQSVQRRLQFALKYDPSLSLDDLVGELIVTVTAALQKTVGLSDLSRVRRYASRSANNALRNLARAYSRQKRQRVRKSERADRVYESVVESLPEDLERFDQYRVEDVDLRRDPILLKSAYKAIAASRIPFKFKKLKFLQLLLEGYSWAEAIRRSQISEASLDEVLKVLSRLLRKEGIELDDRTLLSLRVHAHD